MSRKLCLITGASAGIGAAFARKYAEEGWDLALTARRKDRLEALAKELTAQHDIDVLTISADLSDSRAPENIVEAIENQGRHVDALVNNAGYGLPGVFTSAPWRTHADFIQLMMTAPAHLIRLVLPGMQERKFGRIINVCSVAGYVPGARGHTLYGASKAFLIKTSQSLHLENRDKGVHVTALSPGFTYSEFHDVNNTREMVSQTGKWMWQSAEAVVESGYDAVENNVPMRVPGFHNKVITTLSRVLPESWALGIMAKQSEKIRDAS